MKVGFLLHLYQPPTQTRGVFTEMADKCYIPLIKLLRSKRNISMTLNTPLSWLEQMDNYGYASWIAVLRELVETERVELCGSGAYHPILTKFPASVVESQIILNEYALGYYFGKFEGFEGNPSIMVKDLTGFFPPELAVNLDLCGVLDGLGYTWVVVDECALQGESVSRSGVHVLKDHSIKIISRTRDVSNLISFKRDTAVEDVLNLIYSYQQKDKNVLICLDGECFGHHFKEGMYLLDTLVDLLTGMGIEIVGVSDMIKDEREHVIETLSESSWGATDEDVSRGNFYPFWDAADNSIQSMQWDVMKCLSKTFEDIVGKDVSGYENLPIWKTDMLDKVEDTVLRSSVEKYVLLSKCMHSDQFWWASRRTLPTGEVVFDKAMILRGVELFKKLAAKVQNEEFTRYIEEKSNKITESIKVTESINAAGLSDVVMSIM